MKNKSIYKRFFVLACVALAAVACDQWADDIRLKDGKLNKTVVELLQENPDVSIFVSILQKTGYDLLLQNEQSVTVFAPQNSVLQGMDLNNIEQLKSWVQNYIALLACYTGKNNQFETTEIQMINGKKVHVTGSVISGANVTLSNIAGLNGVIHIIDAIITDRMNIWEYLLTQTGYDQISLIRSYDKEVMDMSKSVQTGVDIQGRPVYDTVWTMHNNFLQDYPLTDENQLFTCILLDNDALSLLKEKYSKYYLTPDAQQQELTVATELASDLLLKYQPVTQAGRFESVKDLLVDIDPANIRETYQASNGLVYKVSSADIKIYENKIKTQIIEAEDYVSRYASNDNAWARRYRSWANGGMDMMLKGITRNTVEYDTYDETGDSIIHSSVTFSYNTKYRDNDNIANNLSNAYLSYEPTLYSTAYEIYWMAFDDIEKHYTDFTDTLQQPMILEQKLFVSLPGEAALERKSDATVVNNFSTNTILAAKSVAGVFEESQLTRYTIATTPAGIYVLNEPYTGSDQFGDQYKLICPSYGKATFFVANTPREINANSGVMFLDYIKLVPLVDTND